MLLERLIQDTLKHTAVEQAFDELLIPPIPTFDGEIPEDPVETTKGLSEREKDEEKTFSNSLVEFQGLAESLVSQTVFNLMQEAMHGAFDLTSLPRQIVTKGFRVKETSKD
jgi:hypothetical protein